MGSSFRARRRSSFHAGMILLILAVFSYANDLLEPQDALFWGGAGLFWLCFAFKRPRNRKERQNAFGRRAFYNHYFGSFAAFAPWIPYLFLLPAFLITQFRPSMRGAVWALLILAAAYTITMLVLMARFLRRWKREMAARIPPSQPPWDGADGVL